MKVSLTTALFFVSLLLLLPLVQAQEPPSTEEMKKLDFMVGRWEGEGWMMVGPGQRHTAKVVETGQRKLEGNVLMIEGVGKATVEGKERVVHNALGLITYDRQAKVFRMRAYRGNGQHVDAEVKVNGRQIEWGFPEPRLGQVRYITTIKPDGEWFEFGEFSRDEGKTWVKFMEMTLAKKE